MTRKPWLQDRGDRAVDAFISQFAAFAAVAIVGGLSHSPSTVTFFSSAMLGLVAICASLSVLCGRRTLLLLPQPNRL